MLMNTPHLHILLAVGSSSNDVHSVEVGGPVPDHGDRAGALHQRHLQPHRAAGECGTIAWISLDGFVWSILEWYHC